MLEPVGLCPFSRLLQQPAGAWRLIRAYTRRGSRAACRLPQAEPSSTAGGLPPGAYRAPRPSKWKAALQSVSAGQDSVKAQLTEKILPLFSAGLRVSREIGNPTPENLLSFKGNGFDIFFSHVGEAYALLTITNHSDQTDSRTLGEIASKTGQTAKEILKVLSKLGVSLHEPESLKEPPPPEPAVEAEDVSIDPELDGILDTANFKKEDVDAFWESMTEKKVNDQIYGGDSLSYDQARQLGLTPSEEEK